MFRTIHGLTFQIFSPSHWELVHSWPDVRVAVFFYGHGWHIRYQDATHGGVTRSFRSRDEAIALLAARRQSA